jgi:hypothetical protein
VSDKRKPYEPSLLSACEGSGLARNPPLTTLEESFEPKADVGIKTEPTISVTQSAAMAGDPPHKATRQRKPRSLLGRMRAIERYVQQVLEDLTPADAAFVSAWIVRQFGEKADA